MQTDYKSSSIPRDLFKYIQEVVPKKVSFQIRGKNSLQTSKVNGISRYFTKPGVGKHFQVNGQMVNT